MDAIREAIAIGEKAKLPVQITHIKLGTVGVWGKASEVVAMIDAARKRGVDVTADVYPYLAWSSNLKVLVPEQAVDQPRERERSAGRRRRREKRSNDAAAEVSAVRRQAPGRSRESSKASAKSTSTSGSSQDDDAGVIGHTMIAEADMQMFYAAAVGDGGERRRHRTTAIRAAPAPSRACSGRFVREEQWLSLPEAIQQDDVDAGGAAGS